MKLPTLPVGGVLCTSEAWLLEFFEALKGPEVAPPQPLTDRQRQAVKERAAAELERAGI